MFPRLSIGHYTDSAHQTGLTVFLPESPMKCRYFLCGGAPATHELALLEEDTLVEHIDALVFTGGSAFGLGAVSGVMQWLREHDRGFPTAHGRVPIVPAAAIYDLDVGAKDVYPSSEAGYQACDAAVSSPLTALVGAGTGARVGRIIPGAEPSPGGFRASVIEHPSGVSVGAYVVLNCIGNIVDARGRVMAGAKKDGHYVNISEALALGHDVTSNITLQNTTLVAIFTNANCSGKQLKRIAKMASAGIARCISPTFTPYDGDIVFASSLGEVEANELIIGELAAQAVQKAILTVDNTSPSQKN